MNKSFFLLLAQQVLAHLTNISVAHFNLPNVWYNLKQTAAAPALVYYRSNKININIFTGHQWIRKSHSCEKKALKLLSFLFDTVRLLLPSILQTDAADKNSCNFLLFRPGWSLTCPVVALQNHRRESTMYCTILETWVKLNYRQG